MQNKNLYPWTDAGMLLLLNIENEIEKSGGLLPTLILVEKEISQSIKKEALFETTGRREISARLSKIRGYTAAHDQHIKDNWYRLTSIELAVIMDKDWRSVLRRGYFLGLPKKKKPLRWKDKSARKKEQLLY